MRYHRAQDDSGETRLKIMPGVMESWTQCWELAVDAGVLVG